MWDLQTAVQAVAMVAVASLLVPPLARGIGGICAVIGFCGVVQSSSWAPTVMALGMVAWFVVHWSFAVRNDVHYRSRLARVVIDKTPLRWAIPRYWQLRRQRRMRKPADTSHPRYAMAPPLGGAIAVGVWRRF